MFLATPVILHVARIDECDVGLDVPVVPYLMNVDVPADFELNLEPFVDIFSDSVVTLNSTGHFNAVIGFQLGPDLDKLLTTTELNPLPLGSSILRGGVSRSTARRRSIDSSRMSVNLPGWPCRRSARETRYCVRARAALPRLRG